MDFEILYKKACQVVNPRVLTEFCQVGDVGAALLTDKGNIYTGVCIDTACAMGFCAEHSAIASMISAGESGRILKIIAVNSDFEILPPCGRCREFISQLSIENMNTEVMISKDKIVKISDLLPHDWKNIKSNNREVK